MIPDQRPSEHFHYPLHVGEQVLATCRLHYGQEIAELDREPEPPIDLLVAIEQKLRTDAAIRRAQKRAKAARR